jgi:hypothetical protein
MGELVNEMNKEMKECHLKKRKKIITELHVDTRSGINGIGCEQPSRSKSNSNHADFTRRAKTRNNPVARRAHGKSKLGNMSTGGGSDIGNPSVISPLSSHHFPPLPKSTSIPQRAPAPKKESHLEFER